MKIRKQLYRAGSVLQDIFYMYREKVFDYQVTKVEMKGNQIYLYLGYEDGVAEARRRPGVRKDVCLPFPSKDVPNLREKQAILVYSSSAQAVAWMFQVVEICLEGLYDSTTGSHPQSIDPH
jgi:hypothetical protein